jgi:hypothetical protein
LLSSFIFGFEVRGMGQTSYVYILWLVILGAGLWIILGFGSLIHAREDLAGDWELTPEEPSAGSYVSHMRIEQSGRYLRITLPQDRALRMKIVDEQLVSQRFVDHKRVTLNGDATTAIFEGRSRGDLWRFSLDGAVHGSYIAHLTDRTYPRPAPATQRSSLSVTHAR